MIVIQIESYIHWWVGLLCLDLVWTTISSNSSGAWGIDSELWNILYCMGRYTYTFTPIFYFLLLFDLREMHSLRLFSPGIINSRGFIPLLLTLLFKIFLAQLPSPRLSPTPLPIPTLPICTIIRIGIGIGKRMHKVCTLYALFLYSAYTRSELQSLSYKTI